MNKIILYTSILCLLILPYKSYAQYKGLDELGKTSKQILSSYDIKPCEVTPNKAIRYCVEGGSFITYLLTNDKVHGILFGTAHINKESAEKELVKDVESFSKKTNITPHYGNGKVFFYVLDSGFFTVYSVDVIDRTYYLIYGVMLLED